MRHFLRRATAVSHEALDSRLGGLDLADRDGYARFLATHFIGAVALAADHDAFVGGTLRIDSPDYVTMLAGDLRALGTDPASLPQVPRPARLHGAAVAYVVAGSRLGTATLSRRPNWGRAHGVAHAYLDDRHGLTVWRALLGWMEAQSPAAEHAQPLVASAQAAFAVFDRAFVLSAVEAPCR